MQEFSVGEPVSAQRSKLPALGSDFFPWCTGVGRVAFPLGRPALAFAGECNPSTSLSTSSPLEQKALVRMNEGTGGIENMKSDKGGTISGRTCCVNRR